MSDKWYGELIANILVIHRKMVLSDTNGVYKKDFDDAYSALRAAITQLETERDNEHRSFEYWHKEAERYGKTCAELEAQLKEAEQDIDKIKTAAFEMIRQWNVWGSQTAGQGLPISIGSAILEFDLVAQSIRARVAKGKG